MDIASQMPVVEGGPAGSGVFEATISAAPELHRGAALGDIMKKRLLKISRRIAAWGAQPRFCRVASQSPLPAAGGPGS